MAKHRNYIADKSHCHRPLYVKMKLFGLDKFYIELIEECPCESKEQLRKREGHYIKRMGTRNVLVAGNTTKETNHNYYENNKENTPNTPRNITKHIETNSNITTKSIMKNTRRKQRYNRSNNM